MSRLYRFVAFVSMWSMTAWAEESEVRGTADDALDTMVVTATRTEIPLGDSPVATEVISRSDIEDSGTEDLATLLEDYPGVDITRSYLGASIRLQGLEPEHVLILMNGHRVLGMKGGVIDLSRFALDNVERIEIVKGPSSALYGSDAMGGVINIITREASAPFSAQVHARGGTLSTVDASGSVGIRRERWSGLWTGGYHTRDSFDLDPSDDATTGSASDQFDVTHDGRFELSSDLNLSTHLSYWQRELQGVDLSASGAIFDRVNVLEEFQLAVQPRWVPSERALWSMDGSFSIFRDQYLSDQRGSSALDRYEETRENLGELLLQHDRFVGSRHHFTLGVDGLVQQMLSERLSEGEGQRYRVALFAQDIWNVFDSIPKLTIVPGARLDLDSAFGVYPTPKIGVRYDPAQHLLFRASYGWGYRAPVFKELLLRFENPGAGYLVEGNPDLRPENSKSVQFGLEADPRDWVWFSMNGFYNDVENLIGIGTLEEGVSGEPTRYGYINVASAMTRGMEVSTRLDWPSVMSMTVGYTLTDSLDRERDRRLEGRALHRGNMKLNLIQPSWGLHGLARATYVGARPFYLDLDGDDVVDTLNSDPYWTMDVRISQRIGHLLELFVGGDNLFDVGDARYLQIPPRFFYFGLTGRFAVLPQSSSRSSDWYGVPMAKDLKSLNSRRSIR